MVEKVNPSPNRPADAFTTAGAITYGGGSDTGYIVPAGSPTELSIQDTEVAEANLNAFDQTSSSDSYSVSIDAGEAFIFGSWVVIDDSPARTVTLTADQNDQTVYLGWSKSSANDAVIGIDADFDPDDQRIPLWTFTTDTNGVVQESIVDGRTIGYTESIGGKSFYGDSDFSLSYNPDTDELEIKDEINNVVKASFDKNGDVHIKNGDLDLRADLRDDTTTVYNSTGGYLEQAALENDSITLNDGDGISASNGSVSLGGSTNVDVNVDDLVGPFISNDGTNAFQVNLGATLQDDGSGNIIVDGSSDIGFSSTQTFTGNIDLASSGRIKNSPSPADPDDLAPKAYVDSTAEGLNIKDSVAVSSHDVNIDLTSTTDPNPLDGYTLQDGERIMLKHQNDATENGIYDAVDASDPTTWVRSSDFDDDADVTEGAFAFIRNGDTHGDQAYTVTTPDPITVGTDPINWSQFSFAGELNAGTNLTKTDNIINLDDSINLAGTITTDAGQDISAGGAISGDEGVEDSGGNKMLDNVATSGQVTLSSGLAEISTNVNATDATFMLALGIDDPNADAEVAGSLFWDDDAGNYEIRIRETETSVGNPTVNYDVLRVR